MRLFLALAVALALSGCADFIHSVSDPTQDPTQGHEHAVFRMFVDGAEVDFAHEEFDFATTRALGSHLHVVAHAETTQAQWVIHAEGPLGYTLRDFFTSLGLGLDGNDLTLHELQGGQELKDTSTRSWELWVDGCADGPDGPLQVAKLFDYAPDHHDRMILVHGAPGVSNAAKWSKVPTHAELDEQLREAC